MLRSLCLALLLPACAATPRLSADFEAEPVGPLPWAPDNDLGWARYEPLGNPPGDVLKTAPDAAAQIAVIPPGPLPTRALRIAAPGASGPVSLRAVPASAPLRSGTITVSFSGRFEAPEGGFTGDAQWILVATNS